MDKTILRPIYLDQIKEFIDKPFIKIITGLRRSGKSELMKMIKSEVLSRGVPESHTVFINFEELSTLDVDNHNKLAELILSHMTDDKRYYLFLDEVQIIPGWEKVVNGLRLKDTDIYITGSNSKLLAGEWSTLLGGRCLTFTMHTLSYSEFLMFRKECGFNDTADLQNYIDFGGFPVLSVMPYSLSGARKVVQDIFNTALYKDVVERYKIRNIDLLNKIVAFLFDSVGSLTSFKNITNTLKTGGRSIDPETVANYVNYLEEAFIIKRVAPYDIKGKQILSSNGKYYLGEHSLLHSIRGIRPDRISGVLENIVFNDLQRRGYEIYVGRIGDKEVDFVAEKENTNEKIYVQVCLEFASKEVIEREFSPLKAISDNYPKYVVNMDRFSPDYIDDGIVAISLDKFLLTDKL